MTAIKEELKNKTKSVDSFRLDLKLAFRNDIDQKQLKGHLTNYFQIMRMEYYLMRSEIKSKRIIGKGRESTV